MKDNKRGGNPLFLKCRGAVSTNGELSHRNRPRFGQYAQIQKNNLYNLTNKIIKKNPKKVLTNGMLCSIIITERRKEVKENV